MVLVVVGALDLRHRDEMVCHQRGLIMAGPLELVNTLIHRKVKFFSLLLKLLRLIPKHVFKSLSSIVEELGLSQFKVVHLFVLALPLADIFGPK